MAITTMTTENYDALIASGKPVLIDFWAEWCGPCKMLSPIVDEVADEVGDEVCVCKVNVDEQRELAEKYEVMSIPTLILLREGKIADTSVGVRPKETILKMLGK